MTEEGDSKPQKVDSFAALRYKDFRSYVGMRFCFTFAYSMQTFVLGYYIWHITQSKMALGGIGLCEAIPAVCIALYGGYIADKSEKRKMLMLIFGSVIVTATVIFTVTLKNNHGIVNPAFVVPIVYSMIFVNGIARAFYGPATFTIYAQSIPKEVYPNGSTWSSSSWQAASILGPAVAGLIIAYPGKFINGVNGVTQSFGLIIIMLLISFVLVASLRKYPPVFVPKENIWKSLSEGIHFVFNNKMMIGAMSLDLFSVFFGGVVALLPVFADEILKVGAERLGIMRVMESVGAILTMLVMTRFSPMGKPWRNLLVAVTGFGVSIICFALSRNFYLSIFCLFTYGAFDSVSVIIRGTIMQLLTPDHMRGRVSAVNQMFIGSSNEIGAFESGMAAQLLGTIPSVIFGGSMTMLIVGITYLKTKKLIPLSLGQIQPPEVSEEEIITQ
ncbi:MFS transporter [Mucilaginibacter flavus]|uniref:MFS transporter n=1 Tax=Mucilaginibacter flavus TaxID=931504 RepID=UPI0025B5C9A5|nr:MFS transporter [Mucilaginibacter flavus]MDN3580237.1 MFS transporter [Mucilaginibacter flavus]